MSTMSLINRVFGKYVAEICHKTALVSYQVQPKRNQWNLVKTPKPGIKGKSYRRIVHFKNEYTIEPLKVTNLGGRDPVTGAHFYLNFLLFTSMRYNKLTLMDLTRLN